MWTVLTTIQLPVLVLTVIVVPQQRMKDFHHNQKGKKLCESAVVDPSYVDICRFEEEFLALTEVNLAMTMGMAVGKLATVVDKLPNVVHVVVARPTMPDMVLVAVVVVAALMVMFRYVFLQGQQILLNCGYRKM